MRWIPPRTAVMIHDLVMAELAWYLANLLRFALTPAATLHFSMGELVIVLLVQGLIFNRLGLYRGIWRFASLPDLWNIVRAVALGALAIGLSLFVYTRLSGIPRSVIFLYPAILGLLLGLPRLCYRVWKDARQQTPAEAVRVLIIGAGDHAEALARDLRRDLHYQVVGFADDQPSLRGASINGIPVLGPLDTLPALAAQVSAGMLLIAMPDASSEVMRRMVALCERTGLPCRTMPRLEDIVTGRASVGQIKEVMIEDLLGRDSVQLDRLGLVEHLRGQKVLVTGGGGSIGSELCRQLCRLGVRSLSIVEQSEFNLYAISKELQQDFPDLELDGVLADCGDEVAMRRVFAGFRPGQVFHAAAYKHVPMLQYQLRAAFRNNVMATQCVSRLADEYGTSTFVLISTDKAVNPTSVMGACKRLAEIWCQNLDSRSATRFITVRFGNVLDSAGSVVPLFREQIRRGGPVTVTHPDMTRYFMTIPEACQLILQGAAQGQGGEIFALDMGEPVKICELARQMIRLAGKQPGSDIAIVYTGLRPGEKLFEELFHPLENYAATSHAKIFLAQHRKVSWAELSTQLQRAAGAVASYDEATIRQCVSAVLPSYQWGRSASTHTMVALHPNNPGECE
ncbi:polysaccharide biosynthesis protein [Frateuria aurantia]